MRISPIDARASRNRKLTVSLVVLAGLLALLAASGCATFRKRAIPADRVDLLARRWGIEVVAVRRTAAGTMIDVRYRVLDPEKARVLSDPNISAYLLDEESGLALSVPRTAKIGPLRQTIRNGLPPAGRVLFMLFGNPGRLLQPGSRVTLIAGDLRVSHLVVH